MRCYKRKYDLIGAKFKLALLQDKGRKIREEDRFYRCPNCNQYHLTKRKS